MKYEVRRRGLEGDGRLKLLPYANWLIHEEGKPAAVVGQALTKWGARWWARRMMRRHDQASRSYPA